jgi:dTDP-4-dehydrorhamnose reductase
MNKKVLIFGGSGKLGSEINKIASRKMDVYAPSHKECDITDYTSVCKIINNIKPDVVINAAALVGLMECENNKDIAWNTNVIGALNVARCCNEKNIRLVFISSCVIFDGSKGNYSETDTPSPTNFYAITKVAAEQAVSVLKNSAIVRLDFYPKEKLKYKFIYTDHFTSKIPVKEAGEKVIKIAESSFTGIINIGTKRDTLYNILKPVFRDIVPITIAESKMPNYPKDISLNLDKWEKIK